METPYKYVKTFSKNIAFFVFDMDLFNQLLIISLARSERELLNEIPHWNLLTLVVMPPFQVQAIVDHHHHHDQVPTKTVVTKVRFAAEPTKDDHLFNDDDVSAKSPHSFIFSLSLYHSFKSTLIQF